MTEQESHKNIETNTHKCCNIVPGRCRFLKAAMLDGIYFCLLDEKSSLLLHRLIRGKAVSAAGYVKVKTCNISLSHQNKWFHQMQYYYMRVNPSEGSMNDKAQASFPGTLVEVTLPKIPSLLGTYSWISFGPSGST